LTPPLTSHCLAPYTMPSHDSSNSFDQQYNVNFEIVDCLEIVYEILDNLEDIRIALWKKKDPSHILSPPFNPLKTIGKYR
jgi:hypothetical protein